MLEVEGVHFAYKGRPILRGLDLAVREGEIVGLVGPNGAGKTTLLRLVSGVLRPASGRVAVNGVDLSKLSAGKRARMVAVAPQTPQLPAGFRVIDLVLMGRNAHLKLLQWESRRDMDIAMEALEQTNIADLADRLVESLSGGERQRAIVAMALAQETPLLLMDEPTSSLDLSHQTLLLDLVVRVQAEREGAVLIAMHDLTLAAQYCDRLVMLSDGRCYAEGTPSEVLTQENIAHVYGAEVVVLQHPVGGAPVVAPRRGPRESGRISR